LTTDSCSTGQEVPRLLWNRKVRYPRACNWTLSRFGWIKSTPSYSIS